MTDHAPTPAAKPKPHVFVTGGSGYVGRNLLRHLIASGYRVTALARSENAAEVVRRLGATPKRGDLLDKAALGAAMTGAELLVHAAADTSHGRPSRAQIRTNLEGTRNVCEAARDTGIRRMLQLSTEAVLLSGAPLIMADETTPYPRRFAGAYSETKARAEQIALGFCGAGLEVVVMRPRFVWGRDDTTALPQLIDAARSGKLAWIDGGHYLTSTTHVANATEAIRLVLEKGRAGEIYHITDETPVPFRSFVSDMLKSAGVVPPQKEVPRWLVKPVVRATDYLDRLSRGVIHGPMSWQEYATLGVEVTLTCEKARRELGYKPVISIEEGMRELAARR